MLSKVHVVMFILLVVPDLYIYYMYVRRWTTSRWKRAAYFIPALFLIVYYLIVHFHDDMHSSHQVMVGTLMVVFLPLYGLYELSVLVVPRGGDPEVIDGQKDAFQNN